VNADEVLDGKYYGKLQTIDDDEPNSNEVIHNLHDGGGYPITGERDADVV
jgi:hypothetical protein